MRNREVERKVPMSPPFSSYLAVLYHPLFAHKIGRIARRISSSTNSKSSIGKGPVKDSLLSMQSSQSLEWTPRPLVVGKETSSQPETAEIARSYTCSCFKDASATLKKN